MNPFLLLLVGALGAATLKVEGVGDSVVVFVDGLAEGRTPVTLTLADGRHQLEFKKEEWQTASIRYGLMVDGQTKGKLTVNWATEEVRVAWAEDVARAQEEARAAVEAQRRAAADQAEAERRAEEEERRAAEQARQEAEAARRFAEEEARRKAEEAAREAREAALRVQYMPHREKGVAAMKAGDRRVALTAFRASLAAGDSDGRIRKLVERLEGEVGSVRLQLKGIRAGAPPEILLDTPEGEPFAPADKGKGRYEFADVPADVALELRVGGAGYQRIVQAVPAVKAGARGDANLALVWLGTGSLALTDWPEGAVVTVTDLDREHPIQGPGTVAVTAGHVVVSIQAPTGHRRIELDLASGSSADLPLKAQLPGTVILTGLPAGSMLRLLSGPQGAGLPAAGVPREDVSREEDGVGLAPPLPLPGLLPGEYTVRIDHPALGQADVRFSPEPGGTREQAVLWQTLSGAAAVQAARVDWERRMAASKKMPAASRLALAGAGATAAVAGVGAIFGARALAARGEFEKADDQYRSALAADDGEAAWDRYAAAMERQDALRANGFVSLGGLGLAAAGAGLTVTLAIKGHNAREQVEDWDLFALPAPIPAE